MPNETTKEAYRKLAIYFYLTRVDGSPTSKKIKSALINAATDYRPAYWRRLRNAICLNQMENGYKETAASIATVKNPLTTSEELKQNKRVPKKQKRVKKISSEDLSKIAQQLCIKRDPLLQAAIIIATITGCRPAELSQMKILDTGLVLITGAKKREANDRGLDRIINLPQTHRKKIELALELFHKETDKLITKNIKSPIPHILERRLATITKRIWPKRKHRATLYSLRHQFGSDLKKTGLSRLEIAYLMGHRATKSADTYGNKQSGGKRSIEAGVSTNELEKLIKTDHYSHTLAASVKTQGSASLNT